MSDDKVNSSNAGPEGQTKPNVAEVKEQSNPVTELETTIAKLTKDLENARKGEKYAKATKEELTAKLASFEEQGDYKAKYEEATAKIQNMAMDGALTEAAKSAKAKSIPAVLKLIDRTGIEVKDGVADAKAIETAIAKAKQDYGILFEEVQLPPTGRAAEGNVTSGYDKEIRAAKSTAEIVAVMKRYNK